MNLLFTAYLALIISDGYLTWKILKLPGGKEVNPIMAWAFKKIGIIPALVGTRLILGLFGLYLCQRNDVTLQWLTLAYAAVVVWNFYQFKKS